MDKDQTDIEVRSRVRSIADKTGWTINPSDKQLARIYDGLSNNLIKYETLYCPCVIIHGDRNNDDHICPCTRAKDDIESKGMCRCRLFFATKNADVKRD